jgi:hypothetical protein
MPRLTAIISRQTRLKAELLLLVARPSHPIGCWGLTRNRPVAAAALEDAVAVAVKALLQYQSRCQFELRIELTLHGHSTQATWTVSEGFSLVGVGMSLKERLSEAWIRYE